MPPPPAPARPLVRAQSPEESRPAVRPAPLVMPTPEQLGVGGTRAAAGNVADWTMARRRLDALGATCFQLEKLSVGGYRFVCLLPTGQPNRTHRIEAQATTEAEAIRLALERSEQWAARGK